MQTTTPKGAAVSVGNRHGVSDRQVALAQTTKTKYENEDQTQVFFVVIMLKSGLQSVHAPIFLWPGRNLHLLGWKPCLWQHTDTVAISALSAVCRALPPAGQSRCSSPAGRYSRRVFSESMNQIAYDLYCAITQSNAEDVRPSAMSFPSCISHAQLKS